MTLRSKTLLLIISTMFLIIFFLWIVTKEVLFMGFLKLERDDALQSISQIKNAFNEIIENINQKNADWAQWDDTYKFVIDHNADYIESNLNDETLAALRLNFIMIIDTAKQVVFSMQYYTDMDLATSLLPSIRDVILADTALLHHQDVNSCHSGLLVVDSMPILISSLPIVTSMGKGPIRGSMIFGSFFNTEQLTHVQQLTHHSIVMTKFNKTQWEKQQNAHPDFIQDTSIIITPTSSENISGYFTLDNIHHQRAMVFEVNLPRNIYKQSLKTYFYIMFAIFFTGLLLSACTTWIIEYIVLRRVNKLNKDVTAIQLTRDNTSRVSISGKDELSSLALSVNNMLAALEAKEATIENKNREMRLLMNAVPIGLLSLNEHFEINPEYSGSVELMLQQSDLAGKKFLDIFGFTSATNRSLHESVTDFLEILQKNTMPESEITALNPCEEYHYTLNNCSRWFQLKFFLINRGKNLPCHILVIVENITDRKQLSERFDTSERENLQLKLIAEDPDLFSELLAELQHLIDNSLATTHNNNNVLTQEMVHALFRNVHTIKGSAGPFGLDILVDISGKLEDKLSLLREKPVIDTSIINYIQSSLSQMKTDVQKINEVIRGLFGNDFNENPDIHLRIPLEKIKGEFVLFEQLLQQKSITEQQYHLLRSIILNHFIRLRQVPARHGLFKTLKTASSVIKRLNKNVTFVFNGDETLIDCETARDLNNPLIHLIRNCLDHGIEVSEEDRTVNGKPAQGTVSLTINKTDNNQIVIEMADDGKGIDSEEVKNTAIKKGFVTPDTASQLTHEQIISLILLPGFSTTDKTTEFSGRGVGMDVVNLIIKDKLHGQLIISSKKGIGTSFKIIIPCAIPFESITSTP